MKFETINNQLCRMVEPEPLTDKAQFPCVVRLIQDNTMLGKANKRMCHPETLANKRICNKLTDDGLYMDGNYTYRYEIIGYPVADGSAEWAFYQHKQGHVLSNPKHCVFRHTFRSDDTAWECIKIYQDGWIIDSEPEPKPLLADAKVGDLCKRRDGRFVSLSNVPPDSLYWEVGNNLYYQDGRESLDEERDVDIVYTEPLAPEGSTEWAWQMLMLNIKVWHPAEQSMETTALPKDRFIACHAKSGWEIYGDPPKEPDYVICKRCGGSQSVPSPAVSNTAYTTCPKCGGTGYEIREQKPDDLYLNIKPSSPADWQQSNDSVL